MRILYDESHEREDRYLYSVNAAGELHLDVGRDRETKTVTIVLINGKLSRVEWKEPQGQPFLRSAWHVYGAIANKIEELEARARGTEDKTQ